MAIPLPPLAGLGEVTQAAMGQNPTDAYATPASQVAQRDYAKALMYGTQGKDGRQFPVVQSWTQGVSNMVNALMGGLDSRDANQKDQNAIAVTNKPVASPSEGPSSEDHEKHADAGDMSREADAIASIESKGSGDYSAVGPATKSGDRAYGRYQVMGNNVPVWTQEVLGKSMSPQEFLGNPAAQDEVFKKKFAGGADNDADRASVWFTGRPLAQGGRSSDGYITGNQYVDRFNKAMGAPSQGGAMAFAGPDGGSSSPAVAAMASALKGDPQVAENGVQPAGARTAAPAPKVVMPNGSGLYFDPRLIKPPPQYTPERMQGVMNNPVLTPEAKAGIFQQYRTQGQSIELPYPGGHVLIDPRNPTRQQFIPDLQKGTTKMGDMEVPNYQTVGPNGASPGIQVNPIQPAPAPPGPQSSAAPAVAPAGPAAPPAGPMPVTAQAAPAAPTPPPVAPSPPPVQVASLDPAAGAAKAAAQEELTPVQKQMMAMAGPNQPVTGLGPAAAAGPSPVAAKPPVEEPPAATPVAASGAPATPLGKLSANDDAIKRMVGPEMFEAYKQKKAYEQGQALDQEAAKAKIEIDKEAQNDSNKLATKRYDVQSAAGQAARKQMPNLDLGLALMNDPNFHSGLLSGAQDAWARLKSATLGDQFANAPNEAFDKIISSTILGSIKDVGGGQIRNAEITLLGKANANRTNTDASNRAVLEVSRRALQTTDHLDQIGQAYASGDAVVDPISGKEMLPANIKNGEQVPRHGLDVGYDKLARKFVLEHPSFTPDEIKHYNTIFDTGKDPDSKEPSGGFHAAPSEAVEHLKAHPETREMFEKHFGPADKYLNGK